MAAVGVDLGDEWKDGKDEKRRRKKN